MAVIQPVLLILSISVPNMVTIGRHLTSFLTCATFNMWKAYNHILVFYFSAISRDIDLKFIQDTNRVAINSLKKIVFHRSNVNVTGTVHCFLKVQSYHKNWAIDNFQYIFWRHLFVCPINWNNKNLSEQINDVTKNTSIFDV